MKRGWKRLTAYVLAGVIAMEGLLPVAGAVDATKQEDVTISVEASKSEGTMAQSEAQSTVQEALLSGETVVPVSGDTVTEQELEQAGEDIGLTVSGAYDENGTLTAAVAEESPAMAAAIDEINNDDGNPLVSESESDDSGVPGLSTEDKQKLLAAYAAYQDYRTENADYFGVATSFFTTKDVDSNPIGSLLSMMGTKQDENGYYNESDGEKTYLTVDDICTTIQLFALADRYAVQLMGDALLKKKDEALAQLNDSMSDQEKLLVLADWLTEQTAFDMGYLMGIPAKESKKSPYYDAVHSDLQKQYGEAAADQMTDTVINIWRSTQFGALCEGKCVCLAYAQAYAYLVQWAYSDVYRNASDHSWKSYLELNYRAERSVVYDEDGNPLHNEDGTVKEKTTYTYDANAGAMVDLVRITLNASSNLYGEDVTSAYSEHYWNAVKLDDSWYYVDACYMDVATECLNRDRAETDGQLSHVFFLFSDTSTRKMYKNGYTALDTLHESDAVDKQYEHAWYSYAKGPVSYQDGAWYYFYDSTDGMGAVTGGSTENPEYQVMQRNGDASTPLISFHTSSDGGCTVYNPSAGALEANDELTQQYEAHVAYQKRYPAVTTCVGVYQSKVYFNLANAIYSYDVKTGAVQKVKEYNQVYAKRDWSETFGGRAFTVTQNADKADLSVENHPLSGLMIRDDGTMVVSVATNYALISSPGRRNMSDVQSDGQYGYEFEETNYNPSLKNWGIWVVANGKNDNNEFMWSANFVETISMKDLTGTHHYETVHVSATCGANAFTERRCTTCGAIKPNSREEESGTALDHHYIAFEETYYTKSGSSWNGGTSYVCTLCQDSQTEMPEGQSGKHTYGKETFDWNDDHTACTMKRSCTVCGGRALDCVLADANVTETTTCTVSEKVSGRCDEGLLHTYTATAETGETDVQTVRGKPEEHDTAVAAEKTDPTCTDTGWTEKLVCKRCGAVVQEREEIPALGHAYAESVTQTATPDSDGVLKKTCTRCGDIKTESIARPKSAVTKRTVYVYSGKNKSPTVTVKDSNGAVIPDTEYTLSYTNGRRYVGKHTVVIAFNGTRYSGKMKVEYTIQPAAVRSWTVRGKSKALAASWKANAAQTNGYQIQYARSSAFPAGSRKNAWISSRKTTSKRVTAGVRSGKAYYVRIRAYKTVDGKKVYSNWSKTKRVTSK